MERGNGEDDGHELEAAQKALAGTPCPVCGEPRGDLKTCPHCGMT